MHSLSIPNETACGSDEYMLPTDDEEKATAMDGGAGIVIAREVSVSSEVVDDRIASAKSGYMRGADWEVTNTTAVGGKTPHGSL